MNSTNPSTKPSFFASKNLNLISLIVLIIICSIIAVNFSFDNARDKEPTGFDAVIVKNATKLFEDGKNIFRFETYGDEAFWTGKLEMHRAINGDKLGGVGPGLDPKTALSLGLKIDADAIPKEILNKIKSGEIKLDLTNPAVTRALIKLNAVLGVVGTFDDSKSDVITKLGGLSKINVLTGVVGILKDENALKQVGFTCALCHSTVDNSFAPGIGKRLDGWANRDLNVGAIIALAPKLDPVLTNLLGVDLTTAKKVLHSWGPGKFDAELNLDGKALRPDGKSAATLIPPAFAMAGVNNHTWTGGWGTTTYWNAYVANLELRGQGVFFDERLNNAEKYPIAAREGFGNKRNSPDLVTSKLAALHFYQLAIPAPKPPANSYNKSAAKEGEALFNGKAKCATCHVPPIYTEPGWNTHMPSDICIDDFQAKRSPNETYNTAKLGGLWTHQKGGFYHDGRFATLLDVVNHYNSCEKLNLGLTEQEKQNLVEYLKSL
ncbi:hypothetical protein OCK74_22270 [Chitinophagaceae bacterium LB-8]|uniref:Cytochrome c domain-containing protein n=1 Tax=Paraflavisolibacter caeni TaxID=2982496 RepID=A0A9X2XZN5_9BACT|nr:hypothetical protein [Paraflavisolibacter caeni]MCU7551862.1 hypothetical protein [Paraflavisolibacter caeni]